ncbi:MAG: metal ABC transporter substrate-binding protein [Dehalococcoidia bacterium]
MNKKVVLGIVAAVIVVVIVAVSVRAGSSADIVAGSVFITNIVNDIADGRLEPHTLIRPGDCPGHHDIKPGDVRAANNSKALIIHNYQRNYEYIPALVESADNPGLDIVVIDIMGNWMAPPIQAEAVNQIAQALAEIDPENAVYYQQRAAERTEAILEKGEQVRSRLMDMGVGGVKVVCGEMQAGFLRWAGFHIVATYGRPEDLSTATLEEVITQATAAGVTLVIDNLQSGEIPTLAADIGAVHVTLSNFPGGFRNTETWEKALDKNLDLLEEALQQMRELHG